MLLHYVNSEENKKNVEMFDLSTNNFASIFCQIAVQLEESLPLQYLEGVLQQMGCFAGLIEPDFAPGF